MIPEVIPAGPEIILIGRGADKVVFSRNPKATRYTVYASGMVVEELQ